MANAELEPAETEQTSSATRSPARSFVGAAPEELRARIAATKLRNLLRLNAAFSITSGTVTVAAAGAIAGLLDVNVVWLVRVVGVLVIGFGGLVLAAATVRSPRLLTMAAMVSGADLTWVAATAVVVVSGLISTNGAILVTGVALVTLEFGLIQFRGRYRLRTALRATTADLDEWPSIEVIGFERAVEQNAAVLWEVMTDHELYAKLALNLKTAQGLTPNGPGFQRTCTDTRGRSWHEECTLWEAGRRFDIDVDTSDYPYPYPYPLQLMQGSWRLAVQPDAARDGEAASAVGMTFALQPHSGVRGAMFVLAMHAGFSPILKRIARGWEREAHARTDRGDIR